MQGKLKKKGEKKEEEIRNKFKNNSSQTWTSKGRLIQGVAHTKWGPPYSKFTTKLNFSYLEYFLKDRDLQATGRPQYGRSLLAKN